MNKVIILILSLLIMACQNIKSTHSPQLKAGKEKTEPNTQKTTNEYSFPGSQVIELPSKHTNKKYNIVVSFPGGYDPLDKTKKYPVIYVLDGQWQFPLLHTVTGAVHHDGDMPYAILVGVAWVEENGNLMQLRHEDLTSTQRESSPGSGGAPRFQSFLKEELFPYIESNFHASQERVVTGGSTSSSFILYSLLTEPDMFTGYIPSSPGWGWDSDNLIKLKNNYNEDKATKPSRVLICRGGQELNKKIDAYAQDLINKKLPFIDVKFHEVSNAGHAAVNAECYTRGLQYIFHRDLPQNKRLLSSYEGTYQYTGEEYTIEFLEKGGALHVRYGNEEPLRLNAKNDSTFYLPGLGTEYIFDTKQDTNQIEVTHNSPYNMIGKLIRR